MKLIKNLADYIREEVCDAEKYAKEALCNKAEDKELADMYYELSKQQLAHADMEHKQAVRLIENAKKSGTEVPAVMQSVWDWEHEHMVDNVTEVRVMLEMYLNS